MILTLITCGVWFGVSGGDGCFGELLIIRGLLLRPLHTQHKAIGFHGFMDCLLYHSPVLGLVFSKFNQEQHSRILTMALYITSGISPTSPKPRYVSYVSILYGLLVVKEAS